MKKYRVRLEFRQVENIEIEAVNEKEAEALALDEVDVGSNAVHYSTDIVEV